VQCEFQSWDLYRNAIGTDPKAGAPVVLKIRKHSSDFLHFFGTFILELYIEFLSAPVMFIKFNANTQVHLRLDTFQKASS
jgi:hypothetical protein